MSKQSPKCPKCLEIMEEGFIIDRWRGGVSPAMWFQGIPEKSIWLGLKIRGKTNYQIKTYRCAECGFLESFAIN